MTKYSTIADLPLVGSREEEYLIVGTGNDLKKAYTTELISKDEVTYIADSRINAQGDNTYVEADLLVESKGTSGYIASYGGVGVDADGRIAKQKFNSTSLEVLSNRANGNINYILVDSGYVESALGYPLGSGDCFLAMSFNTLKSAYARYGVTLANGAKWDYSLRSIPLSVDANDTGNTEYMNSNGDLVDKGQAQLGAYDFTTWRTVAKLGNEVWGNNLRRGYLVRAADGTYSFESNVDSPYFVCLANTGVTFSGEPKLRTIGVDSGSMQIYRSLSALKEELLAAKTESALQRLSILAGVLDINELVIGG